MLASRDLPTIVRKWGSHDAPINATVAFNFGTWPVAAAMPWAKCDLGNDKRKQAMREHGGSFQMERYDGVQRARWTSCLAPRSSTKRGAK